MEATKGTLSGVGQVVRADGTVVDFTIQSEITEEQAKRLDLVDKDKEKK